MSHEHLEGYGAKKDMANETRRYHESIGERDWHDRAMYSAGRKLKGTVSAKDKSIKRKKQRIAKLMR